MLPISPKNPRTFAIDIACLTLLLFIFYLFYLGNYPVFTPDEGRYSEIAREMVVTGDFITPRVNGIAFLDKPVLYYWLQAIAISLFGIKEWALRLFPVLFGIAGCLATYLAGRLLFNRRTGLIAAIVLGTTPLYFGGAHYANLDLEVGVLISMALLCFICGIQASKSLRTLLILGTYIFSGLAFLTKGMIGIAFPVMIILAWIIVLNRWWVFKKIHLVAGTILFFAIVAPWYFLVQQVNPEFLHYFFVTQQITRFLSAAEFNNPTPVWFYLPIVIAGFFPWVIFLFQALYKTCKDIVKDRKKYQTELFLLLWAGIIFVFFSIPHSKSIGYILPIFPALALLVGNFLSANWEVISRKNILISIISFVLIGGFLVAVTIILPRYSWLDFGPGFIVYLKIISTIFTFSIGVSLFFSKSNRPLPLFILSLACSVLFLLTLTLSAPHLNQNSAKPLVEDLKTIIKPEDLVINYFKFYQDIPLYLGKRVTLVTNWDSPNIAHRDNWVRELSQGRAMQKTTDWLINEEKFWTLWNSDQRIFVFLNMNYLNQFKASAKSYFYLGKYNDIILLSNKPTYLEGANKLQILVLAKHPQFTRNKSEDRQHSKHDQ